MPPKKTPVKQVKHRRMLRDNVQGLTKPAFTRLARQAGVKSMTGTVTDELRGITKVYLESLIVASLVHTQNARRKTVMTSDVLNGIESSTGDLMAFNISNHGMVGCRD
jgi:histone H4